LAGSLGGDIGSSFGYADLADLKERVDWAKAETKPPLKAAFES
jgi:hypothetical protein